MIVSAFRRKNALLQVGLTRSGEGREDLGRKVHKRPLVSSSRLKKL